MMYSFALKRGFAAAITMATITTPVVTGATSTNVDNAKAISPLYAETWTVAKGGISTKRRRNKLMQIGLNEQVTNTTLELPKQTNEPVQKSSKQVKDIPVRPNPVTIKISPEERFKNRVCKRVMLPGSDLDAINRRLSARWGFTCTTQ